MNLDDLDVTFDGARLLDELHAALCRYVIFPSSEAADAATLWVAATHVQRAWEHATRLVIKSPEKRCGKSRLLDIIEATCHESMVTVNISPAALVRSIGDDPPTLLLDETDTVFGKKAAENNEDLRGILNAGHQRNRPYIRWDPVARSREDCATFAMAALAGIGDLPDTIEDRAVIIRMRRRAAGERVDPFRTRRDAGPLNDLRTRLCAWARMHLNELTEAEPGMPVEDRAADCWEPLCAIADSAGGDWPARARKAALIMVTAAGEADMDAALGTRLLADIRDLFHDFTVSFMASRELVTRLRAVEESPWADMDLTTRGLSDRLRPYGIKPASTGKLRGYRLEDFLDTFARYIPSETVKASAQGADQHEGTDGSYAADGLNRQCAETVSGLTSESDTLTVPDGSAPRSWCRECYRWIDWDDDDGSGLCPEHRRKEAPQ